jgi:hypothetical protein
MLPMRALISEPQNGLTWGCVWLLQACQ